MPSGGGGRGRPRACIHVDLDSVWAMAASFGIALEKDPDPVLHTSVDNFIRLFGEYGIRATFFVTGRDAAKKNNAGIIGAIRAAGHEIANHSMSHRPNFTALPVRELAADIADSTQAIEEATGEKCRGFRAPTYNVNGAILRILEENGYEYDSSILPTFISPLYRAANRLSLKRSFAYGSIRHTGAPLAPYHPDEERVWRRGGMKIVEVPISTMPFFRLPFHASYVFQFGMPVFRVGELLTRAAGTPLIYIFHARELAEDEGEWRNLFPFKEIPLQTRKATYRRILDRITKYFDVVETRELVRKAREAA
ncbi:MAG: polysaccharide deacetylase family protein [Candidatus Aureabacteria bacterium]|nr:polysaccharide deacetylase family protein [Candidatus Auribacterota bacterium]